jgi:PKD repeat protein
VKKFLLKLFIFSAMNSFAQNPLVKQWDYRFGGFAHECLSGFQQTTDRGYILGGYSFSGIGGDKTQDTWGGWDFWIIKLDEFGNKQWDKDFGGTTVDELLSVYETIDGGYFLGGYSNSGASGDKTQNTNGDYDYWVIKIDSLGNKIWDKDFGGSGADVIVWTQQTKDGGYILGGISDSGIGGDKTEANRGWDDYWVVKIDSLGIKQWDKTFGGNLLDEFQALEQTSDNGYILAGYSNTGISGDKTQDVYGAWDYWIVKIDSMGNKQWDKDYGATNIDVLHSVHQTMDEGYILGGNSDSGIDHDKSENTIGGLDYWILKIDSVGNKQWDKDLGGTDDDIPYTVEETKDNGYLIAGISASNAGGDKSENNIGSHQSWAIKTDSLGIKQWDKTLLVNSYAEYGYAIQSIDGCYEIADYNNGPISGDKTQNSWNNLYDYWIVKFCDTTLLPIVALTASNNICPGTCIDFINLSAFASFYQWNFPGANPDTSSDIYPSNICYANPGIYDVQLIATNANGSDTLLLTNYITVYPQPPAQSIFQSGDSLFANAGAASYQWYFNSNIINGATDYFYVASASGDYNVVATDINGCEVEAVINNVIGQSPLTVGYWPITVYPNPVIETLTVNRYSLIGIATRISVYNLLGETIITNAPVASGQWPIEIDCHLLPAGLYFLEITCGEKIYRTKFLKAKM